LVTMNCVTKLAEKHPFTWFSGNDTLQFLMLGCEGTGKTTLLYRLKIDAWKRPDIIQQMKTMRAGVGDVDEDVRDPSYHYEEFHSIHVGKYGIWDVPGSEPLARMWPMFYRYLRMDALLYVVDCFSPDREDLDRIFTARRQLFRLLNENELRCAAVVLILNVRRPGAVADGEASRDSLEGTPPRAQDAGDMEAEEGEAAEAEMHQCFYEMLGVPEIEGSTAFRKRFFKHAVSCADISHGDEDWANVLKDIYKAYTKVGEASMPPED